MPDLVRGRGSPRMLAAAAAGPGAVLADLQTASGGLTAEEASRRLATHGPNLVAEHARVGSWQVLGQAIANPLVVLLAVLAGSSVAGGDRASAAVMFVMLGIGVGLRFVQESRAGRAALALRDLVRVHATVLRDGVPVELPLDGIVPGDIVQLAAGDMVPADVRLVSSKDLSVSQAVLSGESFPVDKHVAPEGTAGRRSLDLASLCWLGSNVASGTATAVVVATGRDTLLGSVAASLEPPEAPTAFDIGMQRLTWLLVAFVAVLVPLEMAKERVIVKHLDSIQNLGAMDVLCTDKTGTLTLDRIILERHCDLLMRAAAYLASAHLIKTWLVRRGWID